MPSEAVEWLEARFERAWKSCGVVVEHGDWRYYRLSPLDFEEGSGVGINTPRSMFDLYDLGTSCSPASWPEPLSPHVDLDAYHRHWR